MARDHGIAMPITGIINQIFVKVYGVYDDDLCLTRAGSPDELPVVPVAAPVPSRPRRHSVIILKSCF